MYIDWSVQSKDIMLKMVKNGQRKRCLGLNMIKYKLFKNDKIFGTEFGVIAEKLDLVAEEEKVLRHWGEIDAFKKQLELTEGQKKYSFYDGPPFATGLPHYGHITAGTIKDIVTRYASQTGHYVERRFGWDCHGLPVEYEVDKILGIRTKDDYQKIGIRNYNEECRKIVMRYSKEWQYIVQRLGRWVDFENDYKTMDLKFMESVWWVFKQIFEKGLVYRGCKVMPYSMQCTTVLSNFEAGQNYKEVFDPSIVVNFPLKTDRKVKLLVWTTTPWTLPSNLALAVHPELVYVKIRDKKWKDKEEGEVWIVAESRLDELYGKMKDKKQWYEIVEKIKGKELEGLEYQPLFDYFQERQKDGCFRVLCAEYVASDSGTGIVHQAPAFGEDDYKVCLENRLIRPDDPPCPIDENGRFTKVVKQFEGQNVKTADKEIIKVLRSKDRIVQESQVKHSYPYCWRSDTPLIYKAHHSWFIKVTDLKDRLLTNNYKSRWVPQFAQEKRFHNWLEDAQDWCFSRNRMWGNPIPIWVSDDFEEVVCVGSIEELKKLADIDIDIDITDIHREFIDDITIPSKQGKGQLKRIEEVFDCWFESGSMPYAQLNYPFSMDEQEFKTRFPADFISEGIDQTRGWFYTLNVISTALFNCNPFKNLVVNGLVLASDGKKMSKRLKNYPDPMDLVSRTGADAIRLYLVSSGLVKGDSLNFKEQGVRDIVKDILIPWYNVYRFLIQNIKRWEQSNKSLFRFDELQTQDSNNVMDQWILAATENLIKEVRSNMENYDLSSSLPKLVQFLCQLNNWYVRLNRSRIKGDSSQQEWLQSLNILYIVILKSAQLMSPFVPFITDMMYQNLQKVLVDTSTLKQSSIHFLQLPYFNQALINQEIEQTLSHMQQVIEIARNLREKKTVNQKQPIQLCRVFHQNQKVLDNLRRVEQYLLVELNCATIEYSNNVSEVVKYSLMPNNQKLGKKLKANFNRKFIEAVNSLSNKQVHQYIDDGKILVDGIELVDQDLLLKQNLKSSQLPGHQIMDIKNDFVVFIDISQDAKLKQQGMRRELINRTQKMRKSAKLDIEDDISIFYGFNQTSNQLEMAYQNGKQEIHQIIKKPIYDQSQLQTHFKIIDDQMFEMDGQQFRIMLAWSDVFFDDQQLQDTEIVKQMVCSYKLKELKNRVGNNDGVLEIVVGDNQYQLKFGEHIMI